MKIQERAFGEMLHTLRSQTGLGLYHDLENHQLCDLGKDINLAEAGSTCRNGASIEDPGLEGYPWGAHKRCCVETGDEGRITAQ